MNWGSLDIRVGACLGRGRMGAVYRARCAATGEDLAVKRVSGEHSSTVGHSYRVLQEVEHPNIIPVYHFEEESDHASLVMALAEGSVDEMVVGERTLVRIVRQVASALRHLHTAGWVHRDVKPANLLWRRSEAVLSDFGLAIAMGRGGPIAPSGTPAYMAPEAFLWQSGPAVDFYALGVTIYELVTGQLPFDGESLQGDIVAKQMGRYAPLAGREQERWGALVDGLLRPDPGSRWDADDVLAALDGSAPFEIIRASA